MNQEQTDLDTAVGYVEFLKPIITAITNSAIKAADASSNHYSEYDIYSAMAISITSMASRHLTDEMADEVKAQTTELSAAMTMAAVEFTGSKPTYEISLLLAAAASLSHHADLLKYLSESRKGDANVSQDPEL